MSAASATVARLREFNRFYTRHLGLMNAGYLESPYSLAEVRVLYELAHRERPTSTDIAVDLAIDEGYLSRMLKRLREQGLVRARPAPGDRRQRWLALSPTGRKTFAVLDARATAHVAGTIRHLTPPQQQRLKGAMTTVQAFLDDPADVIPNEKPDPIAIRSPAPGDLGWVIQRHGELYHEEYGWSQDFERLVARIVGEFASGPDEPRRRCWIATASGQRAGCIFLMPGVSPDEARLRLLLVEPWARGRNLGTRLVATCIDAAHQARCTRLTLWTNDVLVAARHIYERAGFKLTRSERHKSFGKSLVGQTWELALYITGRNSAATSRSRIRENAG